MDWNIAQSLTLAALAGLGYLTLMWKAQARLIENLMKDNTQVRAQNTEQQKQLNEQGAKIIDQQKQLNQADERALAALQGQQDLMLAHADLNDAHKQLRNEHQNCTRELEELRKAKEHNTCEIAAVKKTVSEVAKQVKNGGGRHK